MKKLNKKLVLNKERIARLNNDQQNSIYGGDDTVIPKLEETRFHTCKNTCNILICPTIPTKPTEIQSIPLSNCVECGG